MADLNPTQLNSLQSSEESFINEPFLDIPDIAISDTFFYATPYSIGLVGLNHPNDLDSYMSRFKYLSEPVQTIMFDYTTAEFIDSKLGQKFGLSREQKEFTAGLIRDVLLGDIFIGDFSKSMQQKLSVDENKAQDIASTIVAELFPPALESIKRVQRVKFPSRIQEISKQKPQMESQSKSDPNYPPVNKGVPSLSQEKVTPAQTMPQQSEKLPPTNLPSPRQETSSQNEPDVSGGLPFKTPDQPPIQVRPLEPQKTNPPVIPNPSPNTKPQNPIDNKKPLDLSKEIGSEKNNESLKDELERVANVIDLRSKEENNQ